MKLILIRPIAVLVLLSTCHAQFVENWGKTTLGAQMEIAVSRNDILIGSVGRLQCRARNVSSNAIALLRPLLPIDGTSIMLSNDSGKVFALTAPYQDGSMLSAPALTNGAQYAWIVPVEISTNIPPGEYEIFALRQIVIPEKQTAGELISNFLKITVLNPIEPQSQNTNRGAQTIP